MRVWGGGWWGFEGLGRFCPWEGLGVVVVFGAEDGWVDIVVVVLLGLVVGECWV